MNDAELKKEIDAFMFSRGYYDIGTVSLTSYYSNRPLKPNSFHTCIRVDIPRRLLDARQVSIERDGKLRDEHYMYFVETESFEFFDKLGFELTPEYARLANQDISDWWE